MRNIKLTIEYDGKDFNGWQKQPNKLNIQGEIERSIKDITGEDVDLIASGRTDAGVHALGQVANFKTDSNIPVEKIPIALNTKLKRSIRILAAEEVDERFHSRYNCKKKTYKYVINNSANGTAIYRNLEYNFSQELNVDKMNEAVKYFIGEHDYKLFTTAKKSKSTVRNIEDIQIEHKGNEVTIRIIANDFMHNMARLMVGMLLDVGGGLKKPETVKDALELKSVTMSFPAEAYGLFLEKVNY